MMKLKVLVGLALCSSFTRCRNEPSKTIEHNCYVYTSGRDTVKLSIQKTGLELTGVLQYKLYEKDANYGTVKGKMIGDTLLLDYTFQSEGSQSIRQVAFLRKGNQVIEGYSEVLEKNGKIVFKRPADVKFSTAMVLKGIDCKTD